MMGMKSFFIFLFQIIPFVISDEICIRGYVMDTFCIERGTLFDNPSVKTLVNPEKHSAHCLLDIPECLKSFEILKPPTTVGGNYTRWYKLDTTGLAMAITYGKKVGKECNGCTGTTTQGIIATVRGKRQLSSVVPPVLTVTSVDNSTCESTTNSSTPVAPTPNSSTPVASTPSVSMPVAAPASAPVAAPVPVPTTCFSVMNTVEVQDIGDIPINQLQIGDYASIGNGKFSQVYGFGHLHHDHEAEFLQIEFEGEEEDHHRMLEISSNHLLFINNNNNVLPASAVNIGDNISNQKVKSIQTISRRGVYAPLTQSGDIIVSGIRASNYVNMIDHAAVVNQHHLGHVYTFPRRFYCKGFIKSCSNELYNENGYSYWAYNIVQYEQYIKGHGHIISTMIYILCIPLIGIVYLFDYIISDLGLLYSIMTFVVIMYSVAMAYKKICLRKY